MSDSESRSSSLLTWLLDPVRSTAESAPERFQYTGTARAWVVPAAIGLAMLVISVLGWLTNPEQFYVSYLAAWTFCLTISLGGLFFLFFNHLTKAGWSIVVQRINEALVWAFPMLVLLFIPIIIGMDELYSSWTDPTKFIEGHPNYDEITAGKEGYLNKPFWFIRVGAYFLLWCVLSYKLYTESLRQDMTGDSEAPANLRFTSAWGLPLSAVATMFFSFDVIMSLDAHWFSTIFGIYLFAGGMLGAIALIIILARSLQMSGMLTNAITKEHYHDLGKYLFGFTIFWAYIAFSQYILIWYAGIPEATIFFRERLEMGWEWHSGMLILFHFAIPFLFLLPQITKRIPAILTVLAIWLLGMHWYDMHWLNVPFIIEEGGFHWLDFTTWIGLFGLFLASVVFRLSRHSLVPHKHPYLRESLHFENV